MKSVFFLVDIVINKILKQFQVLLNQMAQFHKGFTWTLCKSTLKTKNTFINLRQKVTPNQGSVLLKIDNERELQYNNDLGWNCHKSQNIPNISVKITLQKKNAHNGSIVSYLIQVQPQVQLMAVKALQNDLFEELALEGITQYDIVLILQSKMFIIFFDQNINQLLYLIDLSNNSQLFFIYNQKFSLLFFQVVRNQNQYFEANLFKLQMIKHSFRYFSIKKLRELILIALLIITKAIDFSY
ncbi:unnamed protein product [Paramecium pentaurelia]|uniref:Uncharacterized protein n=1 Tax=Paramecium pentaurelia TaxID=43138 RepID=A0A8S1T4I0_9CILI|nr:unnamed protein product [Paramecium pentaurelia]